MAIWGYILFSCSFFWGWRAFSFKNINLFWNVIFYLQKSNQLRANGDDLHRIGFYIFFILGLIYAFNGTIRSQSFTYLFFALWIYLLELVKNGNNKIIWLFPVTMVIWANAHGGFLAGLGLILLYGIGEAMQQKGIS
ncbi:MAG: hypothetical protein MZU84_03865 [Sphingobacterium sp.]|nr:hypothetical protein [Sphingobacterium sp.]